MHKSFSVAMALGVMLLAGVGCSRSGDNSAIPTYNTGTSPGYTSAVNGNGSASPALPSGSTPVTPPKSATATAPIPTTLKYNDALNIYRKAGSYFQFVSCRGNPGTMSAKKGTKIMFDNRDTVAHTIKIGKVSSYRVDGYGYVIASAPLAPGQYYITCDGGGSAFLNVEG